METYSPRGPHFITPLVTDDEIIKKGSRKKQIALLIGLSVLIVTPVVLSFFLPKNLIQATTYQVLAPFAVPKSALNYRTNVNQVHTTTIVTPTQQPYKTTTKSSPAVAAPGNTSQHDTSSQPFDVQPPYQYNYQYQNTQQSSQDNTIQQDMYQQPYQTDTVQTQQDTFTEPTATPTPTPTDTPTPTPTFTPPPCEGKGYGDTCYTTNTHGTSVKGKCYPLNTGVKACFYHN